MHHIHLKITGFVQGVGFRYRSCATALALGLVGTVRNLTDGGVEIVAEGPEADLKKFIEWCYTGVGPASVRTVTTEWKAATGKFSDFIIIR